MGTLPWTVRFRQWLAFTVLLRLLWWIAGERPQFCAQAARCPLDFADPLVAAVSYDDGATWHTRYDEKSGA
jgi:hypothetical protein